MITHLFIFRMVLVAMLILSNGQDESRILYSLPITDTGIISDLSCSQVPDSYTFDISMKMQMEVNGQLTELVWHFDQDGNFLGMEQPTRSGMKIFTIMDFEHDLSVILTEFPDGSKKGSFYHGMKDEMNQATISQDKEDEEWYDQEEMEEEENVSITKTGKSKKIAGYLCYEYMVSTGDEQSQVWAAPAFPVKWREHYGEFFMDFSGDEKEGVRMVEGMPMETIASAMDEGELYNMHTQVTEVSLERWTLNTRSYQFSE